MQMTNTSRPGLIAAWLFILAGLIALMVTVGGATRLTDSGLSITEWDLVMGSLPPMSDAAWAEVFEKYKTIPEYEEVNFGMSLAEFKEIFWWEWSHRNLGRFIGLFVFFPLLYWSVRGVVKGGLRLRLWAIFLLVGLQGAIGWFMVASGLSERVDVSQYRLALHLGTAFILFGLVVWQWIALVRPPGRAATKAGLGRLTLVFGAALFCQIILGAFVAGLRAGKTYNTWPLMDGQFVPEGYFNGAAGLSHMFETIEAVQFNHRTGAYLIFVFAAFLMLKTWNGGKARGYGAAIFCGVFLQMLLGIWTLVAVVPMSLGLLHQLGALMLLALTIVAAYDLSGSKTISPQN
ncbi:heme A synthase [Parvularcula marina]|uniref:Heme A synthase n=2 Tax=Parvularcula marina TaxID=2292771 RepID=A0A371RGG9_9PROT|nr:heme A synthase [Parvularcula marina]